MDQLKKLESPFTWEIDENLALRFDNENELCVSINEEPVIAFMDTITLTYIRMVKKNVDAAHESLLNANRILEEMQVFEANVSKLVLHHIMEATKYHYYMATEKKSEVAQALRVIPNLRLNRAIIRGTLSGCKSLVWTTLSESDCASAIDYSQEAVQICPNCPLWHFTLAKNLRRRRNCVDFSLVSTPQEIEHYFKAYELSDHSPYYGIYLAQVYKECRMFKDAQKICLDMYNSDKPIESIFIKLKLALNFTRVRSFEYAISCLDEVEKVLTAPNSTFLLYKGIYFQKLKNFKVAAMFFKQAGNIGNYKADIQYALCMSKLDKNFDWLEHLDEMLKKYQNDNLLQQRIMLHMGMKYYYVKKDVGIALIYFLKAIDVDMNSKELKGYWNNTGNCKYYNVFNFLKETILPKYIQKLIISHKSGDLPESSRQIILDTLYQLDKILWRFQMIHMLKDLSKKNKNKC